MQNLVSRNYHEATSVLRRLRAGTDVDTVLAWLRENPTTPRSEADPNQSIRVALAQSTSTLHEILSLSPGGLGLVNSRNVQLNLNILRNRIVDAQMLQLAIEGSTVPLQVENPGRQPKDNIFDTTLDSPTFIVPAEPWTDLTSDSLFVSRLVSVFLNYVNPYWRYVEDDLLLQDMRSGNSGQFCSPFLVNAICAFACVGAQSLEIIRCCY